MPFDRRTLFTAATATTTAIAGAFGSKQAKADLPKKDDFEPRGADGILERLPSLNLEANEEFLMSFRRWVNGPLSSAASKSAKATLAAHGVDPEGPVAMDKAVAMLKDNPTVAVRNHTWSHGQLLTWKNLQREFHANYDALMTEMEATDNSGPGTLELNPDLDVPDYVRHEYHTQPGGYVGDPFAGHMYHYLTNNFHEGRNSQDQMHRRMARDLPLPDDGKIKRVLDLGCGIGRFTLALKQRFPDAEVWGIDAGAPLVRYGHMRAVDMGVDVNFAHRLAEDSKFPDDHFDIVFSYLLHHEIPAAASRAVFKEVHRIVRPGGFYYPLDFYTSGREVPQDGYSKLRDWVSHRWVHEPWMLQYQTLDMPGDFKKAGFEVTEKGPPRFGGRRGNIAAVKPV